MSTVTDETDITPAESSLRARYDAVLEKIDAAAQRGGYTASEVMLVAVTKYASMEQIRELLSFGHLDLGESRVQTLVQHAAQVNEYLSRQRELPSTRADAVPEAVRWHMIGHLQRNKVRTVLELARLVHSVDSLRLAEELQTVAAARLEAPIEVLIQVNVAGERQKHGIAPAATRHLVDQIDTMYNVRVRGLMCMAPQSDDPEAARPVFARARELFDDIRREGAGGEPFNILSMGMSDDYEVAVECGANVVRVGSALFGPPVPDQD